MKKWLILMLSLLIMLTLAVPAMAQTGEPDAAQNAGTVSAPYTVEFIYDGNQYVMRGDSSVRLSAVLDEVGLTGEAEAVAVSDESLFSASNATGEWIATAHRAFDTDEWMKVTINGVVYDITVTDTNSQNISYIDASNTAQTAGEVTVVDDTMDDNDSAFVSSSISEFLYVNSNLTLTQAKNQSIGVAYNLILGDDKTLTVSGAMDPKGGLVIYGQSGQTGSLTVNSYLGQNSRKDLTVNGGKVEVTYEGYNPNAAITAQNVTINRGTVTVNASNGSSTYAVYGNVTLNNGTLTATADNIAIAGGVTLNGGTLKATGRSTAVRDTVTVAEGKLYKDDADPCNYYFGTLSNAQKAAINGKTLSPAEGNIYAVAIGDVTHGTVTADKRTVATDATGEARTVTLTLAPETGYSLKTLTVKDTSGHEVEVSGEGDTHTFTMPNGHVTVSAVFALPTVSTAYIDENGTEQTANAVALTGGGATTLDGGWYVVPENTTVSYTGTLSFNGDARLILADGATLNCGMESGRIDNAASIKVNNGGLTVYGQGNQTGRLNAYSNKWAAIDSQNSVAFYGGTVTADSVQYGAVNTCGSITVRRGTVNAVSSAGQYSSDHTIYTDDGVTVAGGALNVTAPGGKYAVNIRKSGKDVTLGGGTLTTTGGTGVARYKNSNSNATVKVADDMSYTDGTNLYRGTLTDEQKAAILGKTFTPAYGVIVAEDIEHGTVSASPAAFAIRDFANADKTVTLTATPEVGYELSTLTVKQGETDVAMTGNTFTMPADDVTVSANFQLIPPKAPTIDTHPGDLSLTYGYTTGNVLSVVVSDIEGHTLSYQWYSNTSATSEEGSEISSATEASYTVPTGKSAGTTEDYYCVVTATRMDNSLTAVTTSNVATVSIEKANQTITADNVTATYGDTGKSVSASVTTPATGGGAISYAVKSGSEDYIDVNASTGALTIKKAGTATVIVTAAETDNYAQATKEVTVTIAKASFQPNLVIQNKTYDGQEITYTIENNPGGEVTSFLWEKENSDNSWSSVSDTPKDAGKYRGTAVIAETENYNGATTNTAEFAISKAALTVAARSKTITYGDAPANDGVECSGFVNNETEGVLGGALDYDYSYAQYDNVGNSYTITPKGLTSGNYEISYVPGTLTVEKKEVGLEWSNTSLTYSGSAQTPTAEATGLVNGDTISVTVSGGQTNAGTGYTATASGLTGVKAGNYKLPSANSTTFAIGKTPLTVTAKPKTITYGDAPANDGVEYFGFVNGETASNLSGTLDYDYSYEQFGDVGSYSITPKGLTSGNYEIGFDTGTLTVEQKEIGLTWSNTSLTFNGSAQTPTASATGTVNSDAINVTVTGGQINAGTGYTATASSLTGAKAGNYKLPDANSTTFAISKAAAQVLADVSVSQVYTMTGVSASVEGKMPSDAGTLSYAKGTASKTDSVTVSDWDLDSTGNVTATLSGGAVGDTVTLPVTITSTNYTDSTINVVITLTAKHTQTITASDVTITYGETGKSVIAATNGDGTISYAVKSGDAVTVDPSSGALTIVKVGTVIVTVTAAETATYTQATAEVSVNVNKGAPIVDAPKARSLTYNGSEQALVDAGSTTDGTLYYAVTTEDKSPDASLYTTSIPTATNAGTYYVWYKVVGDVNHLDSIAEAVTVTILNMSIAPNTPTGLVYNGQEQVLLSKGEVTGGTLFYALGTNDQTPPSEGWGQDVPSGKDAGIYYAWYKVEGDQNHNGIAPIPLIVTIEKKPLTVTAEAKSKSSGEADPALTYMSEGLVEGDVLTGALARVEGENVGTYAILQGTLQAPENYALTYVEALFTINAGSVPEGDPSSGLEDNPELKPTPETQPAGETGPVPSSGGGGLSSFGSGFLPNSGTESQPESETESQPDSGTASEPVEHTPVMGSPIGRPIATSRAVGKNTLKVSWTGVQNVDGYDIFIACFGKKDFNVAASVPADTLSCRITGLKDHQGYKVYVRAWVTEDGAKVYVLKRSPVTYCYTSKGTSKIANPGSLKIEKNSVTLKVGKKASIGVDISKVKKKGSLLTRGGRLRYYSTDPSVAKVNKKGKIVAKRPGKCTIYVLTSNGIWKSVDVTVKEN